MCSSAAPAAASQLWLHTRSPRESIPTTFPRSTTGRRRTYAAPMTWAASVVSAPGVTQAQLRLMI